MRGHIRKRGKPFCVKIRVRDPETGKRKQEWFTFHTRREAEAHLSEMLAKIHGGGAVPITNVTVAEYLQDWLKKYAAGNVRATSLRSYQGIVRQHLMPALGRIRLHDLAPLDVQGYYTAKLNPPKPATGKMPRALSSGTVRKHHGILHAALESAVQNGSLPPTSPTA